MSKKQYRIVEKRSFFIVHDETFEEYVKRKPMPTEPVSWENKRK